ncbi:MAG: ZIP family metal transporter [Candidatus Micrarchaeota archaeon]|nr:ZIP family metal transporter [Candidatus Micrarchaeota archaeon]
MVLENIIIATVAISLLSLLGVSLFFFGKKNLEFIMFFLISFSTGVLFGAALFDLLPESMSGITPELALEICFVGIVITFALEKIIHWHHHQESDHRGHKHEKPLGMLTLVGDGFHNFFDGVAIAASFMVSPALGATTTVAVALHEIPHEIGDFGLLLYAGYSKNKAIFYNFLSGLTAIAGGLAFYFFAGGVQHIEAYALAFTAGTFIYIAGANLLPELHKETKMKNSIMQMVFILLGAALIWVFARYLGA